MLLFQSYQIYNTGSEDGLAKIVEYTWKKPDLADNHFVGYVSG